jgi:hypothetical protein
MPVPWQRSHRKASKLREYSKTSSREEKDRVFVDKEAVAFGAARVVGPEELVESCVAVVKEGEEEHEDERERGAERS